MKIGLPRINGKKVSRKEFLRKKAEPGVPAIAGAIGEGKPLDSIGLAVHPSQVADYNQSLAERGITGAHYLPDGTCRITSRKARNQLLKSQNMKDNDAGYGDWAGK